MHPCPDCGEKCDCDGFERDQSAPEDCVHECETDEEFDDDEIEYGYEVED